MQKDVVADYFGGKQIDIVKGLRLSKGAVSQWQDRVPRHIAMELHYLTDGQLEYDPNNYGAVTKEDLAVFFTD